jgi:large repetitive protein
MFDARCVRNLYLVCCLSALAACSNGRGSVGSEPPPSGGAQSGFTVSGTVAGLDGDGLVVQLNDGNDLAVSNNGAFTFNAQLADAAAYSVKVLTQPTGPSQTCTVGNASGTIAAANVTNVAITCATGAFALHVTVSGLAGTGLVLQNNGGDDLPIGANGEFGFPTPIASGAPYNVTVKTPPIGPSQSCTAANGSGTVGSADVNVAVTCTTGTFTISVTVSGLLGSGLRLQNNLRNDLTITGNGTFQFSEPLASGARYDVTVAASPTNPTQSCGVTNGSGTVGSASVSNITISCMTNRFTVGGTISGLAGSRLELRLNNERPIAVSAPATGPAPSVAFTFPTLLASGTTYIVRVAGDPSNPAQHCELVPGTDGGTVQNENVTSVRVTCATASFRIGGSVSGLRGSGLVLRANDGETKAIASDGEFFFSNPHASGSAYAVTVDGQPSNPVQRCTIANGNGTVGSGDVRITVTCATDSFLVGGTVSGLLGTGLKLQNNGGNTLDVLADGSFTFTEKIASGSGYAVTVVANPTNPSQTCSVVSGTESGTVTNADITTVAITCTTANFTVGGSLDRLEGTGLVLQNNGADDLHIDTGTSFTFQTGVPSGAPYNVTVAVQPSGPAQQCTPSNNSGVVGGENVTDVLISCVTTEFSIGGTVSGLNGSGLVLQNNGADTVAIASNGEFKFPTSLPNGAPYSVIVITQPNTPTQACLATSNVGIVNGANVATIQVNCVDSP